MLTSHAIYNKTPRRLDHFTDEAFQSVELANYNAQKNNCLSLSGIKHNQLI